MKIAKVLKRNGWLSLLLAKTINVLDSISAKTQTNTNIKISGVKNSFIVLVALLLASILTGNVFFMVLAFLIGTAIGGIKLYSPRANDNDAKVGDNKNHGSNGSNGSDGSTGS